MTFLQPLSGILAADPAAQALQIGVLSGGALLLFLLFWTLRDSLVRSRSLAFQVFALLLVTALPAFGFLVYLLVRPTRTLKERELEHLLRAVLKDVHHAKKPAGKKG